MNFTAFDILKKSILAAFGLFVFAFGVYLTIEAAIGAAPWDVLNLGISNTTGIKYGTANIGVGLIILIIDVLLREKIGLGMFLDVAVVGKSVDFFMWLDIVPPDLAIYIAVPVMLIGLAIEGLGQFIYMKAGLGCGPRDSLLVGLSRRLPKIPIGVISIALLTVATLVGWFLTGPVGLGTLICAFGTGPIMQLVFTVLKFKPTSVLHLDLIDTGKILFKKTE